METKYYTPADLAELFGVTRETIYNGIKTGSIPSYKFGRLRRISEEQVTKALKEPEVTVS